MRKITIWSLVILTVILSWGIGSPRAGEISLTYRFEEPRVESAGNQFSRIFFSSTVQAGKAGEPTFPFRGATILLPPGEAVSHCRIERREWTRIEGEVLLHPRQYPVPGFESDRGESRFLYRGSVYQGEEWIHPPLSDFRTQYLRGHAIAVGSFSPVAFRPSTREAGYYRSIRVILTTAPRAESSRALGLLRTDPETLARVRELIDNPRDLSRYDLFRPGLSAGADDYRYLIIPPALFAGDFIPLRDFYQRRGMRCQIMTVEDIETSYSGIDTPEKIRNAIFHQYTNYGITHVLLGGDGDGMPGDPMLVPYRGLYAAVQSSGLYEDPDIPADLYYAALDGDWNTDADTLWGEPGEEDFFSEISIGRACVDSADEIEAFINKTTIYQESPVSPQARRALMLGEQLWSNPLTYGGDELDQLIDTCTAYGFSTDGIPPDFDITKHYNRDGDYWDKTSVFSEVNAGTHWLCHAGHCNAGYAMHLYKRDVTDLNFTNDGLTAGFPIVYSYGCYTGAFDVNDCIAEEMVTIDHFAVAFLGNSRFGWFTEGTTNGPSHHFQREFVDAMFSEGYTTLGGANQRSKDETVPFVDLPDEYEPGAHRWCFYCLNLLGDPALDAWTDTPSSMSVNHAPVINPGDTMFAVETDAGAATGSLYWKGISYACGTCGGDGHILLHLDTTIPPAVDSLELTVTAHNRLVYRDTILVDDTVGEEGPSPRLVLLQNVPNPFNPVTVIRYSLEREGPVDLRVYDVAGREVDCLVKGTRSGGFHTVTWRPRALASGIYFYVLRTERERISRKAVLLR
ncbi:MAG: T9SS type A sorting domain-containing protein [Candidatus Krumholzibacteriota bacterium]|nr:T9SS type A sorting domain-containing protein [Candidatus Krumholzibacteriota bacterium]